MEFDTRSGGRWTTADVARLTVVTIGLWSAAWLAFTLGWVLLTGADAPPPADYIPSEGWQQVREALTTAASLLGMWLVARRGDVRARLGLRAPSPGWMVAGLVLGLAVVALQVFLALAVDIHLAGGTGRSPPVGLGAADPIAFRGGMLVGTLALTGLAAALREELLYRAVLFGWLRDRFGVAVGVTVSTLVFGVGHRSVGAAEFATLMGLLLVWLFQRSGSVWPPVVAHATNNLLAVLLVAAAAA